FENASTSALSFVANEMKNQRKKGKVVTWIIDRNVNTTNVCVANCKFCNFYRVPGHEEAYITTMEQYRKKIDETIKFGGNQLLLQGGHHPELGLKFYVDTFKGIKKMYPDLKLHALGPPEIAHICKLEGLSHTRVLEELREAGLDSLPGAGAEILNDRVRRLISKGKCTGGEWLEVMRAAHQLNITTSATMMFGHIETLEERFEHFVWLRDVQSEKPDNANGFLAFIPWPFMDEGTLLKNVKGIKNNVTSDEYVRMIAISRIMLPNIENIQVSWLTVGKEVAQVCLHAGGNDFGSIMIEENVVSAAGAPHRFSATGIQEAIKEAGFIPQLRTQEYEYRDLPSEMVDQLV
ncbi:MAG: CofH family radical SAM protein, partial [Bacteroidetes bacterium]|nr:CofH family radical SAM protein [Bacteroidota bacterium]